MENQLNVVLTGTPSDSHTWNLVFIELFLQENGCKVLNLGACVPICTVSQALEESPVDLVVISSINGHLFQDALGMITALQTRSLSYLPPLVVGGKIGISMKEATFQKRKLIKVGYQDVFIERDSLPRFGKYLHTLKNAKLGRRLKDAV